MREYVHDLKLMTAENEWFDKPPRTLSLDDVPELRNEVHKNPRTAFENVGLLNNRFSRSQDARVRGRSALAKLVCFLTCTFFSCTASFWRD